MTIVLIVTLLAAAPAFAAGLMKPKGDTLPDLLIEEHHVKVTINNGFAVTEVDQTFRNPNDQDLEAIYTFPLPKNAALSELSLWIDGQEVVGEVVEKEKARRVYEEERNEGRETALAEQREYYSFDVSVSPVRALDTVRVRLLYLQPIELDTGIGRYVYPLEEGRIDEEMHSFWDRREKVDGHFSFEAVLRSSYPLDDVRVTGLGQQTVTQETPDTWRVSVDDEQGAVSLNRDIVVYYRLAQDQPARVDLLPYRGEAGGAGKFMLVITPGMDLQPTTGGVDWTVVIDVSGSMAAKIATAGEAVSRALDQLRPQDRFRVIAFSNRASVVTDWQPAEAMAVETARQSMVNLSANGGTNMHAGLKAGLKNLEEGRPQAVILVSDGGANVGPTGHRDFLELLEDTDVRMFTFVMGQGSNRPLLERLAEESNGFSMDVSNEDDLYGRLQQVKAKLGREALHGVTLKWDGGRVVDLAPKRLPSCYFGQQIVVFGRYNKPGPVTLRLEGLISGEEQSWETTFDLPEFDERFPEVERLWAFGTIQGLKKEIDLGGSASELSEAIVELGTEYSIVSDYTSMIVVREERFEELGLDRKNRSRVEQERAARAVRTNKPSQTRVDQQQPMFGNRKAHDGWGGGAAGPAFLGLVTALLGLRTWAGRRRTPRG
jgi:Ca-activated chloride channel family protein